jgi:hypothetical protein
LETIDTVRMKPTWTPSLTIQIADSKEEVKREDEVERARVRVYTDKSGMDGMVGAAVVLYRDGELKRVKRYRLGTIKHHTIYKGEGVGMILGLELIREEQEEVAGRTPLGADNQAAIIATSSIKPAPSHYIWDELHKHLRRTKRVHRDMQLLVR